MLPLMARASQEVLLLVPSTLREAADSLGVARWRAVVTVIVPAAAGGIVTGLILATARAAGETAPLLICNSIFNPQHDPAEPASRRPQRPDADLHLLRPRGPARRSSACGGRHSCCWCAFSTANVVARLLLARSRAKMGGG